MIYYLLKRLGLFVPIFIVVSLVSFGLSKLAPGDPVLQYIQSSNPGAYTGSAASQNQAYLNQAKRLGLDLPVFYFNITTAAYPDTLYRIVQKDYRGTLNNLVGQHGNWEAIQKYWHALDTVERTAASLTDSLRKTTAFTELRSAVYRLRLIHQVAAVEGQLNKIHINSQQLGTAVAKASNALFERFEAVKTNPTRYKHYLPAFHWHGLNNQYHNWISRFLVGDFGISLRDFRPVQDRIWDGLYWTLLINLISLFIAFLLAIPLGVWSAKHEGKALDRTISLFLFLLYSLPSFWIATMLILFFTIPDYGMDWFPSIGLGDPKPNASWWEVFRLRLSHLVLPIFCITYGSLAVLARQIRGSMVEALAQDYIRTAYAKGLSNKKVIWKHAFRNALFPLITIFGSIFPGLIAGSVIIEKIFNLPGMGNLMFDSIYAQDWPVVYSILLIGAMLTMLGLLVADLLYKLVDPRVSF